MKIGDKVICINPRPGLINRGIYTIRQVRYDDDGRIFVALNNVEGEYFASRFELINRYPFKTFRRNLP